MVSYDFSCRSCGGPCIKAYRYCPWCSLEIIVPTAKVNGRRFTVESVRELLQPIIDLNGYVWIADQIGTDESSIRHPLSKQKTISEKVLDRWLTALGLTNALYDGTLEIVGTEPPISKYYEE